MIAQVSSLLTHYVVDSTLVVMISTTLLFATSDHWYCVLIPAVATLYTEGCLTAPRAKNS